MTFKNDSEAAYYYDVIEDFNILLENYDTQQILDDLRLLSLTNYDKLVNIVMRRDDLKRKTARLLQDYASKD